MSRQRKFGPERVCPQCFAKHTRVYRLCSPCQNERTRRSRAASKLEGRAALRKRKPSKDLSDWEPSRPPPAPPGFNPADLHTARPE